MAGYGWWLNEVCGWRSMVLTRLIRLLSDSADGALCGNRTHDLILTMDALYLLS
jgi:hypothetical protein